MPSTTKSAAEELQAQFLDAVRKSQAVVVDGVRIWSEAVEQLVPRTERWPIPEGLPSPAEVVDTVFDLTGELLEAQRQFVHGAIRAATPITESAAKAARTARGAS